jgi:hypothetical protein
MLDTTGNITEVLLIIRGLLRMAREATVSLLLLALPLLQPHFDVFGLLQLGYL